MARSAWFIGRPIESEGRALHRVIGLCRHEITRTGGGFDLTLLLRPESLFWAGRRSAESGRFENGIRVESPGHRYTAAEIELGSHVATARSDTDGLPDSGGLLRTHSCYR